MTAYYNEPDRFKAEWLRDLMKENAIAPGIVDERKIEDVQPSDLEGFTQCHFFAGIGIWSYSLRLAGWPDDRPVWTGSCPCQSFSTAGKQKGTDDARHLWPFWDALIAERRPPVIFGEQVEAAIHHGWLDIVQTDLERKGYTVGPLVLPAAGFGAPHIRSRLWFVAHAGHGNERDGFQLGGAESQDQGGEEKRERFRLDLGDGVYADLLDDPQREGLEGQPRHEHCGGGQPHEARPASEAGLPDGPGPCNGFWRDAEWLPCRDGRWRPVESCPVEMVDGAAEGLGLVRLESYPGGPHEEARVIYAPLIQKGKARRGRLHGYGDGIVAPVAAAFIGAYMNYEQERLIP